MSDSVARENQLPPFQNEPLTDFSNPQNRELMQQALDKVRGELGKEYLCYVGGEWVSGEGKLTSINPSRKTEVVGVVPQAGTDLANQAIRAAKAAFPTWSQVPVAERCGKLFEVYRIMRKRKYELCAWMIFESGKNWAEADADIAEGIDFVNYYCRQMLRLSHSPEMIDAPGEENRMTYIPLGVGVVIPPWNFPLAIMAGTAVAPVIAGNTVVLKPSENSPVVAIKFVEILEEAGLPAGVVNLITGEGPPLGRHLVQHPDVRFISFTGSMKVGCEINEEAARIREGQVWLKRVVAEMGGKNACVVAEDADLDEAAAATAQSAFGFAGQKCSAGSRAIVVADVYDQFVEKLVAASALLKVGPADDPQFNLGAVISPISFEKVKNYIEIGKSEGRMVLGEQAVPDDGFYVAPTIFADVSPDARIAQEEIFGPVIAVIKAKDYDDALRIANGTRFGLTGALFSRSQEKLDRAAREFHVGNLYFNRKCTGAIVAQQPFGGFNMSGTDCKAGGPDYMLQFLQGKSITTKKLG